MDPHRITSAGDPLLADYRELKDAAARRRIEGDELFVAEGPTAIERLIASGHRVRSVLVTDAKFDRMRGVLDTLDAPVFVVGVELLHEIVGFDLHRGAIAAADRRPLTEFDRIVATARRVAVLEGLNDPENLGAIARSARALGVDALVLDPTCIDPYTRRTVRVSMGEILFLPTCRIAHDGWPDAAFERLARGGLRHLGDDTGGRRRHLVARRAGPGGSGARRRRRRVCRAGRWPGDRRVRLPIHTDVDSLNVGAAAAVAFAVIGRGTLAHELAPDLALRRPRHRRPPRRHPRTDPRGAGEVGLRAERVPRARPPARRVPGVLRVPRRADGQARRADQGRARDDRRRHVGDEPLPLLRRGARRDPAHPRQEPADRRPARDELRRRPTSRRASVRCRVRAGSRATRVDHRRDLRRCATAGSPTRDLGHRRDHRALRPVEPVRELHGHAPNDEFFGMAR